MTAQATPLDDNPSAQVLRARARLAGLHVGKRNGKTPNQQDVDQARRELTEARLARYIRELVDAAPPLTAEQRDRLASLLRSPVQGGSNA